MKPHPDRLGPEIYQTHPKTTEGRVSPLFYLTPGGAIAKIKKTPSFDDSTGGARKRAERGSKLQPFELDLVCTSVRKWDSAIDITKFDRTAGIPFWGPGF
ncbi:hypothetical protein HMPREF9374_1301 [Desmospora sp. 8437]|nr:hypothetical protein HMPREF9374_1301 [Desmospora sp. 8437]